MKRRLAKALGKSAGEILCHALLFGVFFPMILFLSFGSVGIPISWCVTMIDPVARHWRLAATIAYPLVWLAFLTWENL